MKYFQMPPAPQVESEEKLKTQRCKPSDDQRCFCCEGLGLQSSQGALGWRGRTPHSMVRCWSQLLAGCLCLLRAVSHPPVAGPPALRGSLGSGVVF